MIKKILYIAIGLWAMGSCSYSDMELNDTNENIYITKVECKASQVDTRAYDADLNWSWQMGDALCGYQVAGRNIRNTLSFVESTANFVCEAFQYMSTDPKQFHFIYPAAAEVVPGTLVAVQDGTWRPLAVTTVENATVETLPSISFEVLSAALELRIFDKDKTTPIAVTGAKLAANTDFVGKWTLNETDMTYEQGYEGKEMVVAGNDWSRSTVVFNMPHYTDGVEAGYFTLTLTDANGGTMTRTLPAVSFVKGKRTVLNIVYSPDSSDDDTPVTPDPEEPSEITGTFTCATYNVDGLPEKVFAVINLNADGPGSSGTTAISQKIATSGWDVVTFQENFSYNTELQSAMKSYYTFGEHRDFSLLSALGTADTDGLGFATLNATCSFTNESWWAFEAKEGGLTEGANTSIKKGIRHYVVSFGEGVVVDFLVTHMNTADNDAQIAAQNNQLTEVANYINSIRSNNRPIIFMGDMNTRYTRNDYKTYFWDKLDQDLVVADPWVEHSWNGVYPTLGSASLMVPSKDSNSTLTEQTGEVVDKIIYINNPNAEVQIKANWYKHDEDYTGMADHKPVVAEFTYTKK
jgi:exonuclease III